MKKLLGILFLVLAVSCGKEDILFQAPQSSGYNIQVIPESGQVPQVHITIKEGDWQTLLKAFNQNPSTQQYIPCDVTYTDGEHTETVQTAGLRLKGNTSRRYPGEAGNLHHVHFGIHFSEYTQDLKMLGTSRLDLKWFKDDPAYCREVFCYDLFRRFGVWTALRSGYTRLWIKIGNQETYMGVYELMEHVKGSYLDKRETEFGGKGGHLWKARWGASLKDANAWMGVDDNTNDYTYELKTGKADFDAAKAQLQAFIRSLNNLSGDAFYTWAEEAMDVKLLLRTYAVNVAVGMWDDYWNNSNNYYFYFNPAGKFFFIPYDYDNTLGTSKDCGVISDSGRKDPLKWGHQSYPLLMKLLGKAEWKVYYISCLKELCQGDFNANTAMSRIKEWHTYIQPYVSNDTGEDMEISDRPASWSNHSEYRILSPGSNNFFTVKAGVVNALP